MHGEAHARSLRPRFGSVDSPLLIFHPLEQTQLAVLTCTGASEMQSLGDQSRPGCYTVEKGKNRVWQQIVFSAMVQPSGLPDITEGPTSHT